MLCVPYGHVAGRFVKKYPSLEKQLSAVQNHTENLRNSLTKCKTAPIGPFGSVTVKIEERNDFLMFKTSKTKFLKKTFLKNIFDNKFLENFFP